MRCSCVLQVSPVERHEPDKPDSAADRAPPPPPGERASPPGSRALPPPGLPAADPVKPPTAAVAPVDEGPLVVVGDSASENGDGENDYASIDDDVVYEDIRLQTLPACNGSAGPSGAGGLTSLNTLTVPQLRVLQVITNARSRSDAKKCPQKTKISRTKQHEHLISSLSSTRGNFSSLHKKPQMTRVPV